MDYELASRELVRALRGDRSQTAARRRLKRSSNVFHAWETGARYPRSTDLLELLQSTGRSPALVLGRFTPCRGGTLAELVSSFLAALVRDRSHAELARQLGVNRNTVARWLSGQTQPRVPQLLALVEVTTQRVLDFLTELVEPGGVPSVAAAQADLQRQRRLAYSRPWAHAVLRALELTQYRALTRHLPGFLASRIGIDRGEEEACLEALLHTKQVRRRSGRYHVRRVLAVDTRADPDGNLALKRHWFRVASERLSASGIPADGLASYNLFAIAEADLEQVRRAHLDYYERVRSIVAESKEPTRVVLVTIGLLPLGAPGPAAVDSARRPRAASSRST